MENLTLKSNKKAILLLESGKSYLGESFGAQVERCGEVVFNTSMTGYQEILTDPSYKGQIIVMTEPHIGNVGVNKEDIECDQIFAEGLIVREISPVVSNWRAVSSLPDFLKKRDLPAISGIDTRSLTKHLREAGVMRGIISTLDFDPKSLMNKAQKSSAMVGQDLVREVSSKEKYDWDLSEWRWEGQKELPQLESHVIVMDFGAKQNILRCLRERGCKVTVVPAKTSKDEILSLRPDGVMLSNGPGDPASVTYAIETIGELINSIGSSKKNMFPIFGICLGHQLLGLALGGKTFKLKFGHRGANHPVKDLVTGKIEITTQNHGFCVDIESLANKEVELTHINLNDQTLEGMKHKHLPIFSVQYHPESSAGPHDSRYLFDRFIHLIQQSKKDRT
ncbi:MAG: carbamoyl phosphate synthase small subunit [Elusimicrobia bacterium RIFCSPLOWO2_02_FULL_39_32]|nr:MAG: carbamoyl phosphate synthase small subunit [Elusimicrobia bacterium GWA2_38_7]OGR79267.1 MAG: carbamoyl phosphate synthase small subunit [Elusimicrobia bacterium RIFCSPHIGHO2_02_FULL_39_36]OGR93167.1 MAG: carbamoyl phosphate synthase small subunit [Elusimicrobia bacterium RIFCSPLOWO2_02_FULL_39_32]OGR99392.1 MAG: carbamoyl phosphate synthase small subunit [Elusimicrobia bacterium RIFCSPLOWO2_12_FULL_39_28]